MRMSRAMRTGLFVVQAFVLAACVNVAPTPVSSKGETKTVRDATPLSPSEDPAVRKRKALDAYVAAGIESLKAGDPERARRHITHALEIDDESPEALNAMALLYKYEGDQKREEQYYRKALRADSGFSKARNNYAVLLYSLKRYKEAITQLEKTVDDEAYDQRAMAFLNLGRCYLAVHEYDKAETVLQRSLRLNSGTPDAMLELADVYRATGDVKDARGYLDAFAERARHTPRSLWIGIRTEAGAGGDKDRLASFEFQLQKMFPDSPEYAKWQAWRNGDQTAKSRHDKNPEVD